MGTTKPLVVDLGGNRWEVTLPVAPVPASRPRVSRWGTYYLKTYAGWRCDVTDALAPYATADLCSKPLAVTLEVVCKRPKKLTRKFPRGDIDNYEKAAFDAVTNAKIVWIDDDQITSALSTKRYAEVGEQPHSRLYIEEDKYYADS